jgi:hypothetical protein
VSLGRLQVQLNASERQKEEEQAASAAELEAMFDAGGIYRGARQGGRGGWGGGRNKAKVGHAMRPGKLAYLLGLLGNEESLQQTPAPLRQSNT